MKLYRISKFVLLISILGSGTLSMSQPYPGYTLYGLQNGTKAYLVDMNGNNYHTWTFPSSSKNCYSSYMLPNGELLRTVSKAGNYFNGGPISGEVQKVSWNGTILWDFIYSTQDYCTHHDICPMPNGNVLMISYERKTATQTVQAGGASSIEMWPDKIVEVEPVGTNGGNIVWEWHAWDHLVQNHDATKDNYGVVAEHPELLNINYKNTKDWMHMNGIDYNPTLDQIAFSSHNLNEVYVIDHSTTTAEASGHTGGNSGKGGDLLYRWGNPTAYGAPGTANFNVVHDAHWVPADNPKYANYLVGFNNQGGAGGKSCVDIFAPPYDGSNYLYNPGSSYAPTTYNHRLTYSGQPTSNNSNSEQFPNGNIMMVVGMSGFIFEVDSNGTQVWSKSAGGVVAQAHRYTYDYITGLPDDPELTTHIIVWPNPAKEKLYLDIQIPGNETYSIKLYDLFGKLVLQADKEKELDLQGLYPSVYILVIETPNSSPITRKISVVR